MILLLCIFAATDKRNNLPGGLVPLVVFIAILGIAVAFGMQTGMLRLYPYPLFLTAPW
jgi:glycerol uptake facilitator-like aquaporin